MYEPKLIADRIKLISKSKNIKISDIALNCSLSKNLLSSMSSGGSFPKSDTLAKIADYLDTSTDYLLGRTQEQSIIERFSSITFSKEEEKEILDFIEFLKNKRDK